MVSRKRGAGGEPIARPPEPAAPAAPARGRRGAPARGRPAAAAPAPAAPPPDAFEGAAPARAAAAAAAAPVAAPAPMAVDRPVEPQQSLMVTGARVLGQGVVPFALAGLASTPLVEGMIFAGEPAPLLAALAGAGLVAAGAASFGVKKALDYFTRRPAPPPAPEGGAPSAKESAPKRVAAPRSPLRKATLNWVQDRLVTPTTSGLALASGLVDKARARIGFFTSRTPVSPIGFDHTHRGP